MARLGPTHGANTGSWAPKFGYEVLKYVYDVQREESIGGFIMNEIVIAMGDMGQKHQKSLVPGWNQS